MPLNVFDWAKDAGASRAVLTAWCATVADALNAALATGGLRAEVECRTRETAHALATGAHLPAPPGHTAPARFTDRVGVSVRDGATGRTVAAVLFVTPDNKADSDAGLMFAVRVAALLSDGVCVVVVDPLPGAANWGTHLQSLAPVYPITRRPRNGEAPILVICPESRAGAEQYQVWYNSTAPAAALPALSLAGPQLPPVALDLEATLAAALQHSPPSA